MTKIEERIKGTIRDIPDFPKEGIIFKDITPILKDPNLIRDIIDGFKFKFENNNIAAIVGIESRGFIFGMPLALAMNIPFVPVRKKGKLPADVLSVEYDLEYGSAILEIHSDALAKDDKVIVCDDLLATGGTATATAELVEMLGGVVEGYAFVVELEFLNGRNSLKNICNNIYSLANY